MQTEIITKREDLLVRRLVLEPGDAMPWHRDTCHRCSVVVRGDELSVEMRDTGERKTIAVHPGLVDWDSPQPRVHRGLNSGTSTYEEVVLFFLDPPGIDPQPEER